MASYSNHIDAWLHVPDIDYQADARDRYRREAHARILSEDMEGVCADACDRLKESPSCDRKQDALLMLVEWCLKHPDSTAHQSPSVMAQRLLVQVLDAVEAAVEKAVEKAL